MRLVDDALFVVCLDDTAPGCDGVGALARNGEKGENLAALYSNFLCGTYDLQEVTKTGITWASEENLNSHSRAVALALDDHELPVRVQAALAITELVIVHDSVRDAVSANLLKLSDETVLEILNHSMETIIDRFKTELLPVASQLIARLRGSGAAERNNPRHVESLVTDGDDDKVYNAMGVAKTIGTVVSCTESSHEILSQVQEVIIPIIRFTLENKLIDLFDNMYDLADALTFRLHAISPNMWPCLWSHFHLHRSVKIKTIGTSNFSQTVLERILPTAEVIPAVNQLEIHLCNPQLELLDY
ncbi:hypothetical protein CY34DRAFT_15775 [Suillus luteus UH-Slu-Lm8-n1]|uniref:Uncharacterized protein n=1 Tax=Suillus luteus UH-Slu-Lm8-n1 TaxID=930992 RepID=A0A0D0AGQ0_9AGAM|nr:hypothetical protein CY34DRAFT_15775 [Suillus luteus UH-Slu-Lm8-n1]